MTALGIVLILLAGTGLGVWGTVDWFHYHRTDTERALLAELRTRRAADQLSRAAWDARQHVESILDTTPADNVKDTVLFDQVAESSGGDGAAARS